MKCPECGKPAEHDNRPFCSKRCADLDLGKWFDGTYTMPSDEELDDSEEEDRAVH